MKKLVSMVLVVCMVACMVMGCGNKAASSSAEGSAAGTSASDEKKSIGFVTFGLGGDFFQALADTFVSKFEEAGWDAQYEDGQFDPTKQIEAAENYIAMDVDVLVIWAVAPEAMDTVVQDAMAKGIKVISFVAELSDYDALMVSDDADLADCGAKLAAQWIDEKFADEDDHSVPVAVLSCRTAETGVVQADELIKIEEFSKKAKFVTEVECADENMATGQTAMENLYTEHPELKVFLSAHSGLATGVNNFFTSASSPVTDFADMGIFTVNGDASTAEIIKSSIDDEAPLRGMVLTGSVDDTAQEMLDVCTGVMDGSLEKGYVQKAGTMFVFADTVDEYLESGTVTSVTAEDFE
ncbi:MAG: sugar ABC transporter substrate-binding protein [Hespellia sp.]|nr:sugar ABC transporter substrate-binding protein [Hespellia sp.]